MKDHTPHPLDPSHRKRLRATAAGLRGLQAPALSYAIATADGAVTSDAIGLADLRDHRPADPADQYPWFSMTKIATATAVIRLHADGHLDLQAPVGDYLRGYEPGRHGQPTLRELLTHTAGLPNPLPLRWVRPRVRHRDRDCSTASCRSTASLAAPRGVDRRTPTSGTCSPAG